MPTAKATPMPSNDKIQPELCLENQVESERSHTHIGGYHSQANKTCTLGKRLRGEKLSSTNHPQLGNKEQAKLHKMCHCSLTYTDPAEQQTKHNLVTVSFLPRPSPHERRLW